MNDPGWARAAKSNRALGYIDVLLRGAGQVMFQNHPLAGLLFLLGIGYGSAVGGNLAVAGGAALGLLASTLTATWLRVDTASLKSGLYGYNGLLVGIALPTFLEVDARLWTLIVLGSSVSTIAFMAVANVLKTWEGPALTFPFVLVTWVLLLGAYALADISPGSMSAPTLPTHVTPETAAVPTSAKFWLDGILTGVSQVFLIGNPVTGLVLVLALATSSVWAATLALLGSGAALVCAVAFGAQTASMQGGLYGFSPVLTAIALGCTFYKPSPRVLIFSMLGVIATVFAQASLDVAVQPFGVPTLTAPFVLVTWLFLLAKGDLAPVPHDELSRKTFGVS